MAWAEQLESGKWRGGYRKGGKKYYTDGTFAHESVAKKAAADQETDIRRGEWADPKQGRIPFSECFEKWWEFRSTEATTSASDRARIDRHILPRWEKTLVVDIDEGDIEDWIVLLRKEGLGEWSIYRIVNLFGQVMAWAVKKHKIKDPCADITVPRPAGGCDTYYSESQVLAVTAEMPTDHDWALVTWILAWTGMRWGELAGLHLSNVDLVRRVITVKHVAIELGAVYHIKEYPKDEEIRVVPIPDLLYLPLKTYVEKLSRVGTCELEHWRRNRRVRCPSPLLFPWGPHGPISRYTYRRTWQWSLSQANKTILEAIERCPKTNALLELIPIGRPHDLRHTYASWLVSRGVPLYDVQMLMGHKDPRTTQRYAHLQPHTAHERALVALRDTTTILIRGAGSGADLRTMASIVGRREATNYRADLGADQCAS